VLPNFSIHEEEDKKNTQTHEKKFKNTKAEFFEIFHEISKTCNSQSLQKEHSLSLSLSLSLHHRERRRKSFTTQILMTTSGGGSVARRRL